MKHTKEAVAIFESLIKSILDDGNTVEFTINDPENVGIVVDEWSVIDDGGIEIPNEWLSSQTVEIDERVAWKIVNNLGIVYPVIYDETLGRQVQ